MASMMELMHERHKKLKFTLLTLNQIQPFTQEEIGKEFRVSSGCRKDQVLVATVREGPV